MKKCKYHCDYGDGENCHYEGKDGCMFIKGKRLTDTESIGMLIDDLPDVPDNVILSVNKTEQNMNDLYYMQFSNAVLETMKTAKEALSEEEYELFIDSVQKLCKQGIRI